MLLWREAVCREMDFTGDRDFIIVQINTQVLIREVSSKGVHTGLRIGHSCKAWGPGLQQARDCRAHTSRGNCSAGSVSSVYLHSTSEDVSPCSGLVALPFPSGKGAGSGQLH